MDAGSLCAWSDARATYLRAKAKYEVFDRAKFPSVDSVPIGPRRDAALARVPRDVWVEAERLGEVVAAAEDDLMSLPSPDAAAFAFKYLVAHGGGRDTDGWDSMLEAEARRFAGSVEPESPSPETLRAFHAWKWAELAAYYASPCPDEVMDGLVDNAGEAFFALQSIQSNAAADMVLKLFPLLLRDMEPRTGEPPLRPSVSRSCAYPPSFTEKLIADLGSVSPHLRRAMECAPSPKRGAA